MSSNKDRQLSFLSYSPFFNSLITAVLLTKSGFNINCLSHRFAFRFKSNCNTLFEKKTIGKKKPDRFETGVLNLRLTQLIWFTLFLCHDQKEYKIYLVRARHKINLVLRNLSNEINQVFLDDFTNFYSSSSQILVPNRVLLCVNQKTEYY